MTRIATLASAALGPALLTVAATVPLAGLLTAGPAAAKDWTKVTIATEGAYEPWNFVQPDGKLAGFEVDLAHDLCAKMKVECTIVQNDWDGMIPALNAGKFDAIMAGMSITPKREEVIDFSRSYAAGPSGFMAPKGGDLAKLPGTGEIVDLPKDDARAKPIIDGMKAMLKGKSIGVQVATIQANFVHHHFDGVATVQEYKTAEQNQLDLQAGRIDAIFAEESIELAAMAQPDGKDLALSGADFRGGPILGDGTGVGLRKNEPELKAMFDRAIGAEVADGSLKKLQDKWFKLDMMPPS